jgi:glycosyltransferase involved in cell wall biosynthesis
LLEALEYLRGEVDDLELVVFGQLAPCDPPDLGFPIHYAGHLYDDLSLRVLYSALDALVVPSRQEAFGQTASESHACGTPVVAFELGGLPDTVVHEKTGYLARPFETDDLAKGIKWVLAHSKDNALGYEARRVAEGRFAPRQIAGQYIKVYERALLAQTS